MCSVSSSIRLFFRVTRAWELGLRSSPLPCKGGGGGQQAARQKREGDEREGEEPLTPRSCCWFTSLLPQQGLTCCTGSWGCRHAQGRGLVQRGRGEEGGKGGGGGGGGALTFLPAAKVAAPAALRSLPSRETGGSLTPTRRAVCPLLIHPFAQSHKGEGLSDCLVRECGTGSGCIKAGAGRGRGGEGGGSHDLRSGRSTRKGRRPGSVSCPRLFRRLFEERGRGIREREEKMRVRCDSQTRCRAVRCILEKVGLRWEGRRGWEGGGGGVMRKAEGLRTLLVVKQGAADDLPADVIRRGDGPVLQGRRATALGVWPAGKGQRVLRDAWRDA